MQQLMKIAGIIIVFVLLTGVGCSRGGEQNLFPQRQDGVPRGPANVDRNPGGGGGSPSNVIEVRKVEYLLTSGTRKALDQGPNSIKGKIEITFAEAVDTASVARVFSLKEGNTSVRGSITWSGDSTTMTFLPQARLIPAKSYRISIGAGALSAASQNVAVKKIDVDFKTYIPGDVDGDGVADVVIGAPLVEEGGRQSIGTASLFSGKTITSARGPDDAIATIKGEAALDLVGWSAAIVGDMNDDGYADVAIGTPGKEQRISGVSTRNVGAVSLFSGKDLKGKVVKRLQENIGVVSGVRAGERFGDVIVRAGDLDRDGTEDLFVSAPSYTNPNNAGRVYFFSGAHLSGAIDADRADAVIECARPAEHCGSSIALTGDVNGDGVSEVIIGAPRAGAYDEQGMPIMNGGAHVTNVGAAYLFSGLSFRGHSALTAADALTTIVGSTQNSSLGIAVAGGDVNGDGRVDLLVGASGLGNARGGVLIFYGPAQGFRNRLEVSAVDASLVGFQEQSFFGSSIALGHLRRRNRLDLAVGAPGHDRKGAVYIYADDNFSTGPLFRITGETQNEDFGQRILLLDHLTERGLSGVVIGASAISSAFSGTPTKGHAYLFLGDTLQGRMTTNNATATLTGKNDNDQFGLGLGGYSF